eukprot:TRINITY_DN16991_c0_g5_i1.p1 TRINITY_DN16991_c0_g5~~TRINITY_DN16991_c0_g5_i1.p1  ORF type:complete len:329 (-),score=85.23 TRINITY_DN16991_c0_g5_i1:32-1018(-)
MGAAPSVEPAQRPAKQRSHLEREAKAVAGSLAAAAKAPKPRFVLGEASAPPNPELDVVLTPRRLRPDLGHLQHDVAKPLTAKRIPQKAPALPKPSPDPWEEGGVGERSAESTEGRGFFFDPSFRSRHVQLSPDQASASVRGQLLGGFAVSSQVLKRQPFGRWFELRIEECDPSRWSDGLGIGVAAHPSKEETLQADACLSYEGFACDQLKQSWMFGYDGRAKLAGVSRLLLGPEFPLGVWKPSELVPGDTVGVLVTREGHMLLFQNQKLRYLVSAAKVPWNVELHACLDLEGSSVSVRLLDTNGAPPSSMQKVLFKIRAGDFADLHKE